MEKNTIKVLKGLATGMCAAKERHLLKPLETLMILKSFYTDKPFVNSVAARLEIAAASLRSEKQIKRRLERLIEHRLIIETSPGCFTPIAWEQLKERYNISHTQFYYIKLSAYVKLEYIIKAKILTEKKRHCKLGYKLHLKRKSFQSQIIEEVAGTLNSETVANYQLSNFICEGVLYSAEERAALSMRYIDRRETHLNGDLEINYKTGSKLFGFQSYGGYAVLKRSLIKQGVITVEKRRTQILRGTNTTLRKRKVRLGYVKFEKATGEAWLIQPDKIEVLAVCNTDAQYLFMRALEQKTL